MVFYEKTGAAGTAQLVHTVGGGEVSDTSAFGADCVVMVFAGGGFVAFDAIANINASK